jgi:lipoprotein NlpD
MAACQRYSRPPVGDHSEQPAHNPGQHTVRQGDTLYSVAFMYGFTVEEIATWNRLQAPYTIYRGQRLRLSQPPAINIKPEQAAPLPVSRPKPSAELMAQPTAEAVPASRPKTHTPVPAPAPSQPKSAVSSAPRPAAPQVTVKSAPVPPAAPIENATPDWSWPANGPLLSGFNQGSSGLKGISIGGKTGQDVRAAASGKVVYAGSGLSGYGRLLIIKHNDEFLSAYAHNRTLIAKEAQWVKQGEVIAEMGSSGTDRTQLHFEIRKKGKPVDPLRYLPGR